MLIYGTAVLAARRAAAKNRDEVVILPGPPLWRLMLEELAYNLGNQWKRLTRLFGRLGPSGRTASADAISSPQRTDEPRTR